MKSNLDVGKKYQALMEQKKKVELCGAFGVLQYTFLCLSNLARSEVSGMY